MKNSLLIILLFVCYSGYSQIIVNKANLYVEHGDVATLELPGLTVNPSSGPNQTWNLSALSKGNLDYLNYEAGTSASFPAAVSKLDEDVSIGGAFTIPATRYYGSVDGGFGVIGISVPQTTVPIDGITGTAGDKITFAAQDDIQNAFHIPFPLTYGGKYTTSNRLVMDGKLTAAVLSLSNADFAYVEHTIYEDTVTGWGTMRLPHPTASSTIDYEVLRVDRKITVIDSVYIQGMPAPSSLLAQFGLIQGRTNVYYRSQFYSPNSKLYMLRINYMSDATFSTPHNAFSNASAYGLGAASDKLNDTKIWPNPVSGNTLNVQWNKAETAHKITLTDIQGRIICNRNIQVQGQYTLSLPEELPSGLYTLEVTGENGIILREKVMHN